MAKNKFLSAREASLYLWSGSPRRGQIPKIHHFGTKNLFEIRPRNKRPMVPKVEPPAPQRSPKYAEKSKKSSARAPLKATPEKTVFLTAQNIENVAPVQAGVPFLPGPSTTQRSRKRCPKEIKSDPEA